MHNRNLNGFLTVLAILAILTGTIQKGQSQLDTFDFVTFEGRQNGRDFINPFTGGMNNPQICPIDLNRDGLKDMFIFDRSGDVNMTFIFRNGRYEYAPEYLKIFPEMEEWVVIRDYNKDGVEDIFTSSYTQGPQGVEVYTGVLENGRLSFKFETFSGKPSTMLNIPAGSRTTHLPVDYIDYPDINDIDNDGDLDILSFGPNSGYLYWYRNLAAENGWSLDSLRFRLEDFCWGKFFESGISSEITLSPSPDDCASFGPNKLETRHAGSTVLSWDLDNNGSRDLLIGDVGSSEILALLNGGTPEKAYINDQIPGFPDYDVPADMPIFLGSYAADYDHDGDDDLLIAPNNTFTSENKQALWRYENTGTQSAPVFRFRQDDYLMEDMMDMGLGSAPQFVDFDQDGLTDIVAGSGGYYAAGGIYDARLFAFRNIGDAKNPAFELVDEDFLGMRKFSNAQQGSYFFTPTFGDLDDDGDLDVIVGEIYGKLFYGENVAGPGRPIQVDNWVYNYMDISVRSYSAPFIVDLNEDGKPDLVIGARQGNNDPNDNACSNFYYFENIGTASAAAFDPDPDQLPNTRCLGNALFRVQAVSPYTSPLVLKTKDDFMLLAGNEEGKIRLFTGIRGNIYGTFTKQSDDLGTVRTGSRLQISATDIDDDGFYELVTGNYRGGLQFYRTGIKVGGQTFTPDHPVEELSIFPNPAGKSVRIQRTADTRLITCELVLFNMLGQKVWSGELENGGSVDITDLLPGQYGVLLQSEGVTLDVEKLIILPE